MRELVDERLLEGDLGVTLLDFGARLDLGRINADWRNFELAFKLNNVTDRVYAFCSELCEYGARRTGLVQLTTRW